MHIPAGPADTAGARAYAGSMMEHSTVQILAVAQESWATALLVAALLLCYAGFGYALSAADIAGHRLPNRLVARWLLASVVILALLGAVRMDFWPVLRALFGMALLCGGYLLVSLVSSGAMGMGDVKLASVLGLNLAYFSLPSLFLATLLAFVMAALFVLGGTILRRLTLKSAVPFGPFMILGALIALGVAR
ncbi:prepilin peptidase [Glutamicibacter soli]|uniref:Prepilin peptidase n=2 Tax=Glutamicibacter soli TaxID=453836 RepID=A0A365YJM0_9MICC|nr:prepilin peptidase [Glutamicibacter soli]